MSRSPKDFHLALRLLHGVMAGLVLSMLFIGVGMVSTVGPIYSELLSLHRPLGILILVLVVARLPLRLITGAPMLPADLPVLVKRLAKASHILLYASMLAMPLLGWAMLSAGGYPVTLVKGLSLPAIAPPNLDLYWVLRQAHTIIGVLFFALIIGHLTAALAHGLVRRDGVLRGMTLGHGQATEPQSETDELDDDT